MVNDCPASFAGPGPIPVAHAGMVCAPPSWFTVRFGPAVIVGGSFCERTVIVKVCGALVSTPPLAVPPLSFAWMVTMATPAVSATGVKVSVPLGWTAGGARRAPGYRS
jgi:hypothetical protein